MKLVHGKAVHNIKTRIGLNPEPFSQSAFCFPVHFSSGKVRVVVPGNLFKGFGEFGAVNAFWRIKFNEPSVPAPKDLSKVSRGQFDDARRFGVDLGYRMGLGVKLFEGVAAETGRERQQDTK